MRGSLWIVSGAAVALFALGLISFPRFPSAEVLAPPLSIDRTLKGDRLPSVNPAVWPHELGQPVEPALHKKIPVGCDAAFSPVADPRLADVFGRCMA
jgi:hypothetical protein